MRMNAEGCRTAPVVQQGSTNQKVLPLPTSLSTPMRPPWASTASVQKVNPQPVRAIDARRRFSYTIN